MFVGGVRLGLGGVFLSCVCVGVGGVVSVDDRCVCVCDLLICLPFTLAARRMRSERAFFLIDIMTDL